MKYYLIFLTLCSVITSNAQNRFKVTLHFDSSINMEKTSFRYYNGKADLQVQIDTLKNTIIIEDNYYSSKAVLSVDYTHTEANWHRESFFIGNKPATISFHYNLENKNSEFFVTNISNAVAIYDTAQNKIYKKFVAFTSKETIDMQNAWQHYGNKFGENDSVTTFLKNVTTRWNNRAIQFCKGHSQDYFSFWWFKSQIVDQAEYNFPNDVEYFKTLAQDFLKIFSKKYTASVEGKELLQKINKLIKPTHIRVGEKAPEFVTKDIGNNAIRLSDFKGKDLLLHFWATWCVPCKQQIPIIQRLHEKVNPDSLTIISVCVLSDLPLMKKNIQLYKMNWRNIYDKYNEMGQKFDVSTFPGVILINKNGIIKYMESGNTEEIEKYFLNIINNMSNGNKQ